MQNLLEKVSVPQSRDNALQMVQCKVLKQLELMQTYKYDDEEFVADIQFMTATLQANVADLRWNVHL